MLSATMHGGPPALGGALSSERLHLILLPTERCNFRCTYCYEDFHLSCMPPDVVRGVKRLLEARVPELRRLDLSWFGGEPLAALDVVREIMVHVRELAARHPAARIAADMTTNADLLTPETAGELLRLGVARYQITLDGVQADHDAVRRRPNGSGTFARVWEHLVALRDQSLPFAAVIRIHATAANADRLPELLEACAGVFAHDPRFSFFIRPLARLGGVNDATLPVLEPREGRELVERLRRRAEELGLAPAPPPEPICYAAKANAWVIRANGDLSKCTVALADPRNRVGRLHPDGTCALDPSRLGVWLRGLATGGAEELTCPWKALGAGKVSAPFPKSAA